MNIRMALLERAAAGRWPAAQTRRLMAAAGFDDPPAQLTPRLARGLAVAAAALVGFALVLWIAANWPTLGRAGRFALLQAAVIAPGVAAWAWPGARSAMALLALLAMGALWAFFGQTYQTGADAWQLFALWAVLGLPLALGARSDVAWAPWALVAVTAVVLWYLAVEPPRWGRADGERVTVPVIAWCLLVALVFALGPLGRRVTGAGPWAMRTAVFLAVVAISARALMSLFGPGQGALYGLGLGLLALAAGVLVRRDAFDPFALSAVALAIDTLLVAGIAHLLFDDGHLRASAGSWLLMGLLAAALLALTVHGVMQVVRRHAAEPAESRP